MEFSILRALWLLLYAICSAQAKPFVHQLFSSNMVLQRDASVYVWGWTTVSASVTVSINGQTSTTVAGSDGLWQVAVGPFPVGGPYTLQVTGPQSATFNNVMMGDVLLCSGQSNMDLIVNFAYNATAEAAESANYPNIRMFTVPQVPSLNPEETLTGGTWLQANPANTGYFSAVGYYSAREIFKQQGVPIGILSAPWGGTRIEGWVAPGTALKIADYSETIFNQAVQPVTIDTISGLYNGLIAPLARFRVKAVVWYQGEFDSGNGPRYGRILTALLSDWRTLFGQPNLPFIVIQLANTGVRQVAPVEAHGYAEIREAQSQVVAGDASRSRIVSIIDIGEGELHPRNKQDVGLRTSWAAANLLYGQTNATGQGPVMTTASPSSGTMSCTFSNVGAGLMVGLKDPTALLAPVQQLTSGTLNGFALAGADRLFYFANARITSYNTVSVSSSSVPAPVYVRYGWETNPTCNLYAKITDSKGIVINGLPASSVRNDPVYQLSVNSGSGGFESYTIPEANSIQAIVPAGYLFHHWGGDVAALASTESSSTVATLKTSYSSVRAYFQVNSAPIVIATAQVGSILIQWTAIGSVHYTVQRSRTKTGPYAVIASNLGGLSYRDKYPINGTTYFYQVIGVNEVGPGPASSPSASVLGLGASASTDNPSGETAAHAFDSLTSSKWVAPSVASAWLGFSYGTKNTKNIIAYGIISASDVPERDPTSWRLEGSNTGTTWTTLDIRTSETFSARSQAKIYSFSNSAFYAYYRLNILANASGTSVGVQLSELVFQDGLPLNRAEWVMSALATPNYAPVSNVVDGDLNSRWASGASQFPGQWFQVDLGSPKIFHQVILDAGTSANDYPRGYEVVVSNDGINWSSPVATGVGSLVTTISFQQQLARHIRIYQTGSDGGWWSISEININ